jgi:OFA family oxalate/formate antiporter-like MFS transporter
MAGAGFVLSTFAEDSVILLYVAYGMLSGLGIGFIYNSVIGSVNSWFPDKKGLSAGVLMMSFGISTLIIGKIADSLFDLPGFGWRNTYYLLAALIVVSVALFTTIARMPSEKDALPSSKKASGNSSDEGSVFSSGEMIRRASFWQLFIFFTLCKLIVNASIFPIQQGRIASKRRIVIHRIKNIDILEIWRLIYQRRSTLTLSLSTACLEQLFRRKFRCAVFIQMLFRY